MRTVTKKALDNSLTMTEEQLKEMSERVKQSKESARQRKLVEVEKTLAVVRQHMRDLGLPTGDLGTPNIINPLVETTNVEDINPDKQTITPYEKLVSTVFPLKPLVNPQPVVIQISSKDDNDTIDAINDEILDDEILDDIESLDVNQSFLTSKHFKMDIMIDEFKRHGYTLIENRDGASHIPLEQFLFNIVLCRSYEATSMSEYLPFTAFVLIPNTNTHANHGKRYIHFQVRVNDLPYFEVRYEYRYLYHYFNFFESIYNDLCEHLIMKLFVLKEHLLKPSKINRLKVQNCYTKWFNSKVR
jgi:hypothetical protein